MSYTWVEPFAGAAACALRLVGGRNLMPPCAWMGGKRRLALAITQAMGVPAGPPARVVLADAGPWGWVWPLLLEPGAAARVAAVLRSWSGEHPRDLWQRLAAQPPAEDVHERAAQWLWLQARSASGVPIWWDGWRLEAANGKAPTDRGEDLRWPAHQGPGFKTLGAWRMGDERGDERGVSQKGTARGQTGGLVNPCTIADRVEAIAEAFRGVEWSVHHGDVRELAVPAGAWVYDDPPYEKATGYGWNLDRAGVLALAAAHRSSGGACVAVSEAVPLDLPGWHHVDLTREGGKPEWLTLSRPPAHLPQRQGVLFREATP